MRIMGWIIAAVFVAGLVVAGCIAVVNDEDSLGPIVLIDHEYGGDDYRYEEDSGGYGDGRGGDGRYAGGRSGDNDQRGNENCRNACGNTVVVPTPGQQDEEQPR